MTQNNNIYLEKTFTAPDNNLEIGSFMLVDYLGEESTPHIEFEIFDQFKEYRNQGIVSKEIIEYLKLCNEEGYHRLIAVAKEDNLASMRILEKNNFIMVSKFEDNVCYVTDLRVSKEVFLSMKNLLGQK
jgi:RimJ/RimL family protein N-acetyltransferase